jgi:hypothetical protein
MNLLQKISAEWPLRLGLGAMYLYSGYDLMANPQHWYGFVPRRFSQAVSGIASVENYLRLQGAGEFLLGILFLAWFLPQGAVKTAALLAAVEMAAILIFVGVDPITFRDIGLLGAAFALAAITSSKYRGAPS